MRRFDRRRLLQAIAAGAAASPWFWVKKAHAAATFPAFGRAKHVLVLYAGGGLRSAPLFNADVSHQHNPYGRMAWMAPGAAWCAGSLLGAEPYVLGSVGANAFSATSIPPVPEVAADIAVLAGVDHDPSGPRAVIDHDIGDSRLTTISRTDGDAGLLAIVHRDHLGYRTGSFVLPPFDLGRSSFARATGELAASRPVSIASARDLTGRSAATGDVDRASWIDGARARRDRTFIESRPWRSRAPLEHLANIRASSRVYSALLRHPALDLLGAPQAEHGGASNAALLDVLGAAPGTESSSWGLEVALALRLFQLGVPMVNVYRYLFDNHSSEDELFPVAAADLGRQLAGIHFLLHHLRDEEGAVLWDNTVVVLVSEFSRDNTDETTGLNTGHGSDHQGSPASRNQIWPIFGGAISAKGRRIGALDPDTLETAGGPAIAVASVQATLLALLGIDPSPYVPAAPIGALFA